MCNLSVSGCFRKCLNQSKRIKLFNKYLTVNQVQGWMEDFVIERGPRDIVYSGNMGVIAPISIACVRGYADPAPGSTKPPCYAGYYQYCERRNFLGSFGRNARPGKCLRLKFSETQSSAFWTLKLSKCLDSKLNMYNL